MTPKQKIQLRLSKVRERLGQISALEGDDFTDEVRGELEGLSSEYSDLEQRHRAAILSEAEDEDMDLGLFGDGTTDPKTRELRALIRRVKLSDYLNPAASGVGLTGAPVELAEALDLPTVGASGGVAVPLRVLLEDGGLSEHRDRQPDRETRAMTTTAQYDGPVKQRPILDRLFGPSIMAALGVRMDSVPAGRAEWPLVTTGAAPGMKAEGTKADDPPTVTFATETLKPKRLTGALSFSHEMAASVSGLEPALRRDLAAAVRARMNNLILSGDESTDASQPDGFLTRLSAPTAPGAVATYADFAGSHATAVDGIHAGRETEVRSVIGVESYQLAAQVFQTGSGEAGTEALRRRSGSCVASSYVPAPPATGQTGAGVQDGNIYHAAGAGGGAMRGDSIAAVWPTLEIVRDRFTNASTGIILTWVSLWDAEVAFRSAAYKRIAYKLA